MPHFPGLSQNQQGLQAPHSPLPFVGDKETHLGQQAEGSAEISGLG